MLNPNALRFAIPNKGRLSESSLRQLEKAGIRLTDVREKKLFGGTSDPDIQILFVRAEDIPRYVEMGAADLGITGFDLIQETDAKVEILSRLSFGDCKVVVASKDYKTVKQLNGKRIATKFTNIAKKYFEKQGIKVDIVHVAGATELTPHLGVADAIVDLVSTGSTLAMTGLSVMDVILESTACLIANNEALKKRGSQIEAIKLGIDGTTLGEKKKYLMMNANEADLPKILKVTPGMRSPTILKLAKEGEVAVHVVVDKANLSKTIHDLKKAGARDILVLGTERVIA